MKKQRSREEKGITLVALVVTIIVLIILAGVTLNIVLDNDGIINKAKQAVGDYENSQREEQEMLGEIEGYIEYAGKTASIPEGYTKSQITTEDDIAEGLVIYEIPEGVTVNWTDNEDSNGKNQSTITLPGETEAKNLQETVNQYVWIPVRDINDMVMCESNMGDSVCNLVYDEKVDTLTCQTHPDTATDLVGRLYTGSIIEENNTIFSSEIDFTQENQIYDANNGYREPAVITGNGGGTGTDYDGETNNYHGLENAEAFLVQLKSDFSEMATSVAKNGGFYISRYEVGANGDSRKGQIILTVASNDNIEENYLGANMWYGLYHKLRDTSNNKQMIWGCQYEQVIRFIGAEAQIGHDDRNLTTSRALSGQNDLDKMKNIYDLEGNFWEWTLEAYAAGSRVGYGSSYNSTINNLYYPASNRGNHLGPTVLNDNISSRSILYL